jgi:hypothetical protein
MFVTSMYIYGLSAHQISHFLFMAYLLMLLLGQSVCIATGYGLDDRGVGVREFSLLHVVQTASDAHPASYPMGTGGYSRGCKAAGE